MQAQRVVFFTMLGNIFLVLLKFSVGIMAGSASLFAEAVHSGGDVLASLVVLISIRLAGKPPDNRHHFGHGKIESLCSCLVGALLIIIGFELCRDGLGSLSAGSVTVPGIAALYVAAACIILKEIMYRVTIKVACKTGSQLLFADAWHHRSDMMILAGVFAGIAGARLGYPILDGLAALAISVMIVRLGISICWRGMGDLVDTAPSEETITEIINTVHAVPDVDDLHCLRARQFGTEIQVELHIGVNENLPVRRGHEIAQKVKQALQLHHPEIKHVLVHVNPVRRTVQLGQNQGCISQNLFK